jgi:hypothetical protein
LYWIVFSKFYEQSHFSIAIQSSKGWKEKKTREKRNERKKREKENKRKEDRTEGRTKTNKNIKHSTCNTLII